MTASRTAPRADDLAAAPAATPATPQEGHVLRASGPVVVASVPTGVTVGEVVRVGSNRLLGEVIRLEGATATIQVYEETTGIAVGDPVELTGSPLVAWLGPGLLGRTYDGLQRPLDEMAEAGTWLLLPGVQVGLGDGMRAALGAERWDFEPTREPGDVVGPGDVLGFVQEAHVRHRILVPPDVGSGTLLELPGGEAAVDDVIGRLRVADETVPLRLGHAWPVRRPRPVGRRLGAEQPLVTGQRVIDMLFPVARGGSAVIPGGFGTGKTVVEQQLARWSDADIVVYVGCGERGNEMAELLATFPLLSDPRTGNPLLGRTVLIANTSNMPVAAREASVQVGMTIAEYFRDQGYHVALLADSTSRWAEALREISGRLEELPGEEGFPAYLGSRLAAFYERAGGAVAIGEPERSGSITLVAAVSPPGGDFSEPVTQASLRLAGTFWALDATLAHARHFPAIGWTQSYSLEVPALTPWYERSVDPEWSQLRTQAITMLARERSLLDVVSLVGADALPESDRALLAVARLLREVFLQQAAFDPVDASRPLDVQVELLRAVLAVRAGLDHAMGAGATLEAALAAPVIGELRRAKEWSDGTLPKRLRDLAGRLALLEIEPAHERAVAEDEGGLATDAEDGSAAEEDGGPAEAGARSPEAAPTAPADPGDGGTDAP